MVAAPAATAAARSAAPSAAAPTCGPTTIKPRPPFNPAPPPPPPPPPCHWPPAMTTSHHAPPDKYQDIRDAVRALCAEFPDAYHRQADAQRAYPEAFVA